MVMSSGPADPGAPEHRALTRRFIIAIFVLIPGFLVALGLIAVNYALPPTHENRGFIVGIAFSLAIAIVGGVFAVIYARRIGRLAG